MTLDQRLAEIEAENKQFPYRDRTLLLECVKRMRDGLTQIGVYALINHDRPKDYGEVVADALADLDRLAEKGEGK